MTDLALKSVLHGWRRYLPVVIAVGVSGLMMVAQIALVMGAVMLAAAPVRQSAAQLWVGPADATSLDQAGDLSVFGISPLWLDARVARIEPFAQPAWINIGEDDSATTYGSLLAIDTGADGLALARAIPADLRAALAEPGTVALDRADAQKLKLSVGSRVTINKQSLRVAGLLDNVRGMMTTQFIASAATARTLESSGAGAAASFYMVALKPGADPQAVAADLTAAGGGEYRVWLPDALASSTVRAWALGSGAGTLFLASSAIALIITLMVVSQTLAAAVAGSVREYAALRAYGIGFRRLQGIVMRQGGWVALAALVVTGLASAALLAGLRLRHVAVAMPLPLAVGVGAALVVVVLVSNLFAVRRLRNADPASLLR